MSSINQSTSVINSGDEEEESEDDEDDIRSVRKEDDLAAAWGQVRLLTHSFLTSKQLFPGFFKFFYAIFKF